MIRPVEPQEGYIYILEADTGHYKIGCTKNLTKRLTFFGVKLPFNVTLYNAVKVDDMYRFESWIHRYWEENRVNGEWFRLSAIDLDVLSGFETQADIEEFYSWIVACAEYHNQEYPTL